MGKEDCVLGVSGLLLGKDCLVNRRGGSPSIGIFVQSFEKAELILHFWGPNQVVGNLLFVP